MKYTFKEAYDKIIDAYFKDEIKPMNPKFCFCGTLSELGWNRKDTYSVNTYPYSIEEYERMENALLNKLGYIKVAPFIWRIPNHYRISSFEKAEGYEDKLFQAMCAAIDVLRQIHIERGEDVDEIPQFTKRQLKAAV